MDNFFDNLLLDATQPIRYFKIMDPTQPDPTYGWAQPMFISDLNSLHNPVSRLYTLSHRQGSIKRVVIARDCHAL